MVVLSYFKKYQMRTPPKLTMASQFQLFCDDPTICWGGRPFLISKNGHFSIFSVKKLYFFKINYQEFGYPP